MAHDLDELQQLKDGWDGYDGVPPSEAALMTARYLNYTPMSNGGITIELHAGGISIEIEVGPHGRVDDISISRNGS